MPNFDPGSDADCQLWKAKLVTNGLSQWIAPLERWFQRRLPIAWFLVCDCADPRIELYNSLELIPSLDESYLLEQVVNLRINRFLIHTPAGDEQPCWNPEAYSFEEWLYQSLEVREVCLNASRRNAIFESLQLAFLGDPMLYRP
jgi:hypothetical protein